MFVVVPRATPVGLNPHNPPNGFDQHEEAPTPERRDLSCQRQSINLAVVLIHLFFV